MAIYYVLGAIFIIAEVMIFTLFIRSMINSKMIAQKENIKYFVPTFILLYIMYLTASFYYNLEALNDKITIDVFYSFSLINFVLDTFAFNINTALIYPLVQKSALFFAAYLGASLLATLITVLTVTALLRTRISNYFKRQKAFAKNCDILIGACPASLEYYETNGNCLIWDDRLDSAAYVDLLNKGFIACREKITPANLYNKLKKGEHHIILFKGSNIEYSDILKTFQDTVKQKEESIKAGKAKRDQNNLLFLHIESTIEEMQTLRDQFVAEVDQSCNSYVTCFNKYELLARDFVTTYPITKYVPRDFYESNLALKKGKKINVVMMGFGNINKELFEMMAIEFQFAHITKKDGKEQFESEPVNYYIYDTDASKLNTDTSAKLVYDYETIFNNSDLPRFDRFCNVEFKKLDVNSFEVRKQLDEIVNEDSFTYVIVSLAGDLENVAYAESLQSYFYGSKNIKVFARVKEEPLYSQKNTCDCPKHEQNTVEFFGKAKNILTHKNIINEELIELSQRINGKYMQYTRQGINNKVEWEKLPLVKQYSNIYQALNIFFKLNLLGFWAVKKDVYEADKEHYKVITKDDFYKTYETIKHENLTYDDYFTLKRFNLVGFVEHSRWCAFHFLLGYKPMNFDEIKIVEKVEKDGKTRVMLEDQLHGNIKKHICLTSNYEGLDLVIRKEYLMVREKQNYKNFDIFKDIDDKDMASAEFKDFSNFYYYDFMVLEDIYQILEEMNYVIVED